MDEKTPAMYTLEEKPQKKKGMGCLITILVVVLFFMIPAIFGSNDQQKVPTPKPQQSVTSEQSPTTPTEPAEPEYIEISSKDLLAAYEENGVAADNAYKNKLLKVTGPVDNIDKDIFDHAYVTLRGTEKYSLVTVQCYFDNDNLDGIAQLKPDDVVTIIGVCEGSNLTVSLENCDLVTE